MGRGLLSVTFVDAVASARGLLPMLAFSSFTARRNGGVDALPREDETDPLPRNISTFFASCLANKCATVGCFCSFAAPACNAFA